MVKINKVKPLFIETEAHRAKRLGVFSFLPLPRLKWQGESVPSFELRRLENGSYDCSKSRFAGVAQ